MNDRMIRAKFLDQFFETLTIKFCLAVPVTVSLSNSIGLPSLFQILQFTLTFHPDSTRFRSVRWRWRPYEML